MSAQWREISIPFGGGLDTKTDHKLVQAPKCVDLRNAVFSKSPGWKKRNGYDLLGTTFYSDNTTISGFVALATRSDELLGFDDENLYSYETRKRAWVNRGRCVSAKVTERAEAINISNQTVADTCTHNDLRCTAWEDSSDSVVHYSLTDVTTGTVYVSNTAITGATRPKCVAAGDQILLFYYVAGSTALKCKIIYTSDPSFTVSDTTLYSDVSSKVAFDFCTAHDGGAAFGAYIRDNGGNNETVAFYVLPTGVVATSLVDEDYAGDEILDTGASSDADALAVSTGTSYTHVATADGGGNITVFRNWIDFSDAQVVATKAGATTGPIAVQADLDNDTRAWVWHNTASEVINYARTDGTTTIPAGTSLYGFTVASGGFWFNGHAHVNIVRDSILQSSYLLLADDGVVLAKVVHDTAEGVPTRNASIPGVRRVNGEEGNFSWAGIYRQRLDTSETADDDTKAEIFAEKGVKVIGYDFTAPDRYRFAEAGNSTYISGGIVWAYDGYDVSPASLLFYPEPEDIVLTPGTAGSIEDGVYSYRFYFEKRRKNGDRLKSSAIAESATIAGADDEVVATLPTYGLDSNVYITGFRTSKNPDITAAPTFYRASSADPASSTPNDFIENNTAALTTSWTDRMIDDTLVDNELDYLGTGELDNVAPPACSILISGKGRLWMAGFEDGSLIRYSKLRFPDQPVEFNDALTVQVPDAGGPITGLAILDQFVVAFKHDRIYIFSGPGPNNLGAGSFSDAQLVTADVGCATQASIVETPLGVCFLSDKGIYLLGRDTSVKYIGADVEFYNGRTDIRAATLVSDQNQIRFLDADGRTLVFDYAFGQWSTFTNHEGLAAVNWQDRYAYLRSDGAKVYQENPDVSTDAGAHYQLRAKLAWIPPHGPQGYGRVRSARILGEWKSTHTFKYKFRYDYQAVSDTGTFDPAEIINTSVYGDGVYGDDTYGGSGGTIYQFKAPLPRQKMSTLQVEFWDVPGTSDVGPSYEITDITLEVATKKGPNKMEAGRTSGATGPSTA